MYYQRSGNWNFDLSHEQIGGIIQWGYSEQQHWLPCAAIAGGDDVVPNEAGLAYQTIYHELIRTKVVLDPVTMTEDEAHFEFRGFKGTYEVALVDESGKDIRLIGKDVEVEDNVQLRF